MSIIRTTLLIVLALATLACQRQSDRLSAGAMAYIEGDYKTARRMWQPLAERGVVGAQLNLGHLYRQGQGVPQDFREAMNWYLKAAAQGDGQAQNSLGYLYATGQGSPQDKVQAHMWFMIADASGNRQAGANKDRIASEMSADEIARAESLAREWLAQHR